MGGRDHSCEFCGRGGFNDPHGECECFSVVGIDPSVEHPAFAVWPSKHVERVEVPGSGSQRLCALFHRTFDWARDNTPSDLRAIFIERPTGRFPSWPLWQSTSLLQVATINGSRAGMIELGHDPTCFDLSPGEWKKEIGLKGNAKKPEVQEWAAQFVTRDLTTDEADALAIAAAGHSLLTKGEEQ